MTIATGMEEHNDYAVYFIEATKAIKVCSTFKIVCLTFDLQFVFHEPCDISWLRWAGAGGA